MENEKQSTEYTTPRHLCEAMKADIDTYDGILLGFGTELFKQKNEDIEEILEALAKYLEHKNYFIISSVKSDILRKSSLNQKRIVCPYLEAGGMASDNENSTDKAKADDKVDDKAADNIDDKADNKADNNADNKVDENRQWDLYNKWLSGTLAKKLLVIELGEGFNNPNLIKWPFERIVMINEKAHFYRVHSMFYQIPPEINKKSVTFKYDSYEVLKMLVNIVK